MTTITPQNAAEKVGRPGQGMTVALFITCINDVMFPRTGQAVTSLLERLGCTVEFPYEQTCCGQITTNTGYFDETVPMIRSYVDAFSDYDYVVAPSGSCVAAVRDQHTMIAEHIGDKGLERAAAQTSKRTYDLPEFLVDVLGVTDVGAYFPHSVLPPVMSWTPSHPPGRPTTQTAPERARHDPGGPARRGAVLRFRRYVQHQEPRCQRRHGGRQGPPRARDRRRVRRRR